MIQMLGHAEVSDTELIETEDGDLLSEDSGVYLAVE